MNYMKSKRGEIKITISPRLLFCFRQGKDTMEIKTVVSIAIESDL